MRKHPLLVWEYRFPDIGQIFVLRLWIEVWWAAVFATHHSLRDLIALPQVAVMDPFMKNWLFKEYIDRMIEIREAGYGPDQ